MRYLQHLLLMLLVTLASCATSDKRTIAGLRYVTVDLNDVQIEDGAVKAMQSYQQYLQETPESALRPEAFRRLADLKIQREYEDTARTSGVLPNKNSLPAINSETPVKIAQMVSDQFVADANLVSGGESVRDFEQRTTGVQKLEASNPEFEVPLTDDQRVQFQQADLKEAIGLYTKLLREYPHFERNDQVLYQLSRAYEELGQVDEAMNVMNRMIGQYSKSRHIDEVQFRQAEYFFTRKKYLDAEEAYQAVLNSGIGSDYYELAIYKLGWALFKQDLYEEALHRFVGLLDHKVSLGYDFDQTEDKTERKRIEDNYRVISLSLSYLGGAEAAVDYFRNYGRRTYEDGIYTSLAEYYVDKRRFSDGAGSYTTFLKQNPFHQKAPEFSMRIIDIFKLGGFPKLVISGKKTFSTTYGLGAEYWSHFNVKDRPEVLDLVKANFMDLANHYHALYQDKRLLKSKPANYREATHWYKEYLRSFPADEKSAATNYQLADLYMENKDFNSAAVEYERTAYDYPVHDKSSAAAYSAVYAYREALKPASQAQRGLLKREIIRSSLMFSDKFPRHDKVSLVLISASSDLYDMKDFDLAFKTAQTIVEKYPGSDLKTRQSALMIMGHASFDLARYAEAEKAYTATLKLLPATDNLHEKINENLAAAVYRQGEQAMLLKDNLAAATHFLRVADIAPTSTITPKAEFDAAAALILVPDWGRAITVLEKFRHNYPAHILQTRVTGKLAVAYKEAGKPALAAAEFERIERESTDDNVRREALLVAAELYEKATEPDKLFSVYKRYVDYFPRPLELALETRMKIAQPYKTRNDNANYKKQLRIIISENKKAGSEQNDRTQYLAANASLVFVEPLFEKFREVKLVKPFKRNLNRKKKRMKAAIAGFTELLDYQVGDVTAAATYYMAEIYLHFSESMMESERPDKLSPLELEQYELVLEEQAYPFEEKSIDVHEKNIELLTLGVYNPWIDKSIARLAKMMPARYDKAEESIGYLDTMKPYIYAPDQDNIKRQVANITTLASAHDT